MKNLSSKRAAWLHAFRLRTLPLALSSILAGSFLAYPQSFHAITFLLAVLTTLALQILSNLANDYGDSQKGTDNDERIGPKRAIQAGLLSFAEIKKAILLNVIIALGLGVSLVLYALPIGPWTLFFILLGLAAIGAAIKYTVGKAAYGYHGLGDVFVLLFFGLVGVMGSSFLQTQAFVVSHVYMALAIGLFSVGVLNLNNMRDRESDQKAGKNTLVVWMGARLAKVYHLFLVLGGMVLSLLYFYQTSLQWTDMLPVLSYPLFVWQLYQIEKIQNPKEFDPFLKRLALTTFLFSALFVLSRLLAAQI